MAPIIIGEAGVTLHTEGSFRYVSFGDVEKILNEMMDTKPYDHSVTTK